MTHTISHTTARARTTDPQTSVDAAQTVNVNKGQHIVLEAYYYAHLADYGPLTEEALNNIIFIKHDRSDIKADSPRKRRSELEDKGFIEVVDAKGLTSTGRRARRYQLTKEGFDYAAWLFDGEA